MRAERAGFAVWWVAAATALLLGAGGWAVPREAPPLSALTGVVYDSLHERPLANARVQLQRANLATTTDGGGAFRFADVPAGEVAPLFCTAKRAWISRSGVGQAAADSDDRVKYASSGV